MAQSSITSTSVWAIRLSHCCSTNSENRSSKLSWAIWEFSNCRAKPSAKPPRRMARNRSKVGLVNMAGLLQLLEVAAAADVLVHYRHDGSGLWLLKAVQAGLEHRLDAAIGTGIEAQGPGTGCFQSLRVVPLAQAH